MSDFKIGDLQLADAAPTTRWDMFAAAALTGLLANNDHRDWTYGDITAAASVYADHMVEEASHADTR